MAKLLSAKNIMSDHQKIYTGMLMCSIISLGAIIFAVQKWTKRSHTEIAITQPQIIMPNIILPDEIQYQRAKQLIAQNKILQAIQNLPNNTNTDKKNQSILLTYLAEQEIQKDSLTGRQQARDYATQANTILQNISDTESIGLQKQNQTTILATCIAENQAIDNYLNDIIQKQYIIQSILTNTKTLLAKRELPQTCKAELQRNLNNNQEILQSRIQGSKDKQRQQKQINRELVTSIECDIESTPQHYQTTQQASNENNKYLLTQQFMLDLLKQNPSNLAEQLCQGKNDSQLDNQLSKTMQDLLDQSSTPIQPASNNEVKYQDIDQDIQIIIQDTQTTNNSLIHSIQKTIHTNTYDPVDYIQKLFKEFFGNTKDFISP